jgi:DNA polymerase I-like protein with 3'-5' exonuclease and polymerase domains
MHDEFILEVSKEHADEIAGDVNKMMEFEVNGIAFPVKSRKGDNWDVLE